MRARPPGVVLPAIDILDKRSTDQHQNRRAYPLNRASRIDQPSLSNRAPSFVGVYQASPAEAFPIASMLIALGPGFLNIGLRRPDEASGRLNPYGLGVTSLPRDLSLDELRKQRERLLPAEIASLDRNTAGYAFLHNVQLSSAGHLL